jgi:tetratricopeptide (TPR) repeat protein
MEPIKFHQPTAVKKLSIPKFSKFIDIFDSLKFLKSHIIYVFWITCASIKPLTSSSQAQHYVDSLEKLIKVEKSDTARFLLLQKAFNGSIDNLGFDVVEKYVQRMKAVLEKHPWKRGQVMYHHSHAILLFYQSKYDESLRENNLAVKLAAKIGDHRAMANSYGNIAIIYQVRADYITALKYHFKGCEAEKKMKNFDGVANAYNNIGIIYENIGQYEKALQYQQKSMALRIKLKDNSGVQKNFNNIGTIYLSQDKFDSALVNYKRSLNYATLLGNKNAIAVSNASLGNVYFELYKYDSALIVSTKAVKLFKEVGNERGWLNAISSLAENFLELNKIDSAEIYCTLALDSALHWKTPDLELSNSRILLKINQRKEKYKEAFFLSQRVMFLEDSIKGVEKKEEFARYEVKHEYALKEERNRAKAILEERKQSIILYSVIAGLLISLLFGFVVLRSLNTNKKKNKLIEEQKRVVEEKQKEVMDSIHYAKRIQEALLPSNKYIEKNLKKLKEK